MASDSTSLTESVLRRDRWIVLAGLALLTVLCWGYILTGAGTGMSIRDMTITSLFPHRMADMPMPGMRMGMNPGMWSVSYFIIILLMWWVMMIAMMTPSAAPMILLYARATRHAQSTGQLQQGVIPTAAFVGGYLLVWLGFSLLAAALQWALERSGVVSTMMMASTRAGVSAAILIAAGFYQLSPLKHVCLRYCRAPAEFLSRHWRPGAPGALRMGLKHGAFCVGCCWMLMALLFVGGIMNVLWIAVLAILVLLEKVAPYGTWLSRATGVVLLAWGVATLAV
jgi:predicted metal-binding membrane protein